MSGLYENLGVPRSATHDEIRSAYKRLSLRHHPDRPGGDEEKFKKVQRAHEILTNPEQKSAYNATGQAAQAAQAGQEQRRGTKTIDPEQITSLAQWAKALGKFTNVVMSDEGIPTVLSRDGTNTVVKQFPLAKGHDMYVVLQSNPGELSEIALNKLDELTTVISEKVVTATAEFAAAEQNLLQATDNWRLATTPLARQIAATEVGLARVRASDADTAKRTAEAPRRHISHVENVTRKEMNYKSGDDRVYPSFYQLYSTRFGVEDRVITAADMA